MVFEFDDALVRDVLDQLHHGRRRQDGRRVECAGSYETISERFRFLDRIELNSREDLVWIVNSSKHDVSPRRLLAADRVFIEERFPGVVVVEPEMMNHESHSASSGFGLRGQLRMMLELAIIPDLPLPINNAPESSRQQSLSAGTILKIVSR